jgi:hypothetical protein
MAASTVVCHGGRNHRRPIFWQAGSRLDAQCDHARIAPSALQCGGSWRSMAKTSESRNKNLG